MKNEMVLDALEVQELSNEETYKIDGGKLGSFITGIGIVLNGGAIARDFIDGFVRGMNDCKCF